MHVRKAAYGVFHPGWLLVGIAVGLAFQVLAWVTGFGLLGGLSGYLLMGVVVGWASPGDTIAEPAMAAFVIATVGFLLDHLLLTVLGAGIVLGVGYGFVGLLLGLTGGWVGERLQAL